MKLLKSISFKHIVAVSFCTIVFICGLLTLSINFREVFGGLVRGYIKSPRDSSVTERLTNSLSTFDTRMNEYFILHDVALNSYGGIQKMMDKHLVDDVNPNYNVVKLKNDYLIFKGDYKEDGANGNELKNYLLYLKKNCDNNGTAMLYVKRLDKETQDWKLLPDYYPYHFSSDYTKAEADLEKAGIGVLDLDKKAKELGIDKYSLFYKTDHHWTTSAGLWACNQIADKLNSDYGFNIDTDKLNIDNYTIEHHSHSFLGTQGTRTGASYTEPDDFDFIYPKFPTNIDYDVRNKNIHLSGSFLDTILLDKTYEEGYHAYMPSTYDLTTIKNKESNNGKYAVFVVDSYGSVVAPFLSQTFERVDCIDFRYFSDDFGEYIQKNKPDIVIYMVNSTDDVLLDFVD